MSLTSDDWRRERRTLEVLSSLSYRQGEIKGYLREITLGVSELLQLDWSVISICQDGREKVLASSLNLGDTDEQVYSLYGNLTGTVVETRQSLVIPNVKVYPNCGPTPEEYQAYLGVPLQTPLGEIMGTICSFHKQSRQFTTEEVRIAELFAERAATALDNYFLYQQQLQFNQTLEAEVARRTQELRITQAKLVEQERLAAMGEFAACIIHEIRNPFTTMKMGLDFFQKLDLSESANERLTLAIEEANRLEGLLREVLLYAKPQKLQLEKIDINLLITEMLTSLSNMPEATQRKIIFYPQEYVSEVLGDKDKLKQILINLVRNACEAISSGEVVKIFIDSDSELGRICISVNNGGEPIPEEILPKLTQPFYSTKSSGTGLGLAIVKRIVDVHGGELSIQSNLTDGTTICVGLPMAT